jgi:hypothetical protein
MSSSPGDYTGPCPRCGRVPTTPVSDEWKARHAPHPDYPKAILNRAGRFPMWTMTIQMTACGLGSLSREDGWPIYGSETRARRVAARRLRRFKDNKSASLTVEVS